MGLKRGFFYIGYSFDGEDTPTLGDLTPYSDYPSALKAAKKDHKEEIAFQKEERGATKEGEIHNTQVIYIDPESGEWLEMARISGFKSRLQEWTYD